jgi:putative PEP-CTERM system integral membrane protein
MNKPIKLFNFIFNSTFWGWNLIFIAVVYCGILPFIGIPLILATFDGDVPLDFSLTFLALIIVPVASTYIGGKYLRTKPTELIRFFYGVEAPLFTWCLVRLFLIRELTTASGLVLATLFMTILAFAVEIVKGYQQNSKVSSWLQAIAHSLMLLVGIYLGLVLLFHAIPVAIAIVVWLGQFIVDFFSFNWVSILWRELTQTSYWFSSILLGSAILILFGFSTTIFVGMPVAIISLYLNSGRNILQAFAQQYGKKYSLSVATATISLWLILLFSFNQQPQVKAFSLLAESPSNRTELLASSSLIRTGLINANLSAYRYLGTKENSNSIFNTYDNLGLPKSVSLFLQDKYNQLLAPFLYQGSQQDVQKSAELYADFFDAPLQKAERKSVRHALQSTAIVDEAKAGLLNIDQKKVWLEKQEVSLNSHGDWADVEIHEVYQNKTNDVEEILYYFSLPESAAITGLWLGETDNQNQRFPFQVAPRGAAQEVYNSQVNRTRPVDPALLEQVGVGQYRLRAFPVPPRLSSRDLSRNESQPKMHLWLTYKVMKQDKGWALPQLAEKRNIFWTKSTKRIRNGQTKWFFADAWLEDFWRAEETSLPANHTINLANDYKILVQPLKAENYVLPQNQTYALILDTSYSMGSHAQEVKTTLEWWKENLANNDVDLYVTDVQSDRARYLDNLNSLDPKQLTFFGSISDRDLLQQFQNLRNHKNYDGVLVITDEGSYELSQDHQNLPGINAPLWMIHLGDKLPRAYNDTVLEAIQNTHGGVANDLTTVIKRLATEAANGVLIVDGYSWAISPSDTAKMTQTGIEPLAARQLVSHLSQKGKDKLSLAELDHIHQIAKENPLVTPYSSMIVLVNDRQKELLKQAEARTDRYDREVETGVEQPPQPFSPFEVSGVPEPDFWILLGIVAIALFLVFQRQVKSRGDSGIAPTNVLTINKN